MLPVVSSGSGGGELLARFAIELLLPLYDGLGHFRRECGVGFEVLLRHDMYETVLFLFERREKLWQSCRRRALEIVQEDDALTGLLEGRQRPFDDAPHRYVLAVRIGRVDIDPEHGDIAR